MKSISTFVSIILCVANAASAQSVSLPAGKLQLTGTLELNMSKAAVGRPFSFAPDVAYGVSSDLTLALVHSTFLATGFRGGAGKGLCLAGEENGCPAVYNNVGLEGLLALTRGALATGGVVGMHALSFKADAYSAKLGARVRWSTGEFAVVSSPAVLVAVTKRGTNKDSVWLPILLQYKATPELTVGLGSGIKGPLDGFGEAWEMPLGVPVTYALSSALSLGASWTFGKLLGGGPEGSTGADYRAVHLWATWTR